jgi:hypothetical protein
MSNTLDPSQRYEYRALLDDAAGLANVREILARDVPASDWRVTFADANGERRWMAVHELGAALVFDASTGFSEPAAAFAGGAIAGDALPPGATDIEGGLRLTIQRRDEEIERLRADLQRVDVFRPRADPRAALALELSALADAYRVSGDATASPADRARRQRLFDAVMARAEALIR